MKTSLLKYKRSKYKTLRHKTQSTKDANSDRPQNIPESPIFFVGHRHEHANNGKWNVCRWAGIHDSIGIWVTIWVCTYLRSSLNLYLWNSLMDSERPREWDKVSVVTYRWAVDRMWSGTPHNLLLFRLTLRPAEYYYRQNSISNIFKILLDINCGAKF